MLAECTNIVYYTGPQTTHHTYAPSILLSESFLDVPGLKDCKTKRHGQRAFRHIAISQWNVLPRSVPAGSPSRGGDVAVYVFDINQPSLPTPFCSVLVSISVFMALSAVFHSINSPGNSPPSHSVLPVLFLPYWSCLLYMFLLQSLLP